MPLYVLALYFTALISLGLGVLAVVKNRRSWVNYSFSLMSLSVFGWSLSLAIQYHFDILYFNKVCNFFAIFIPVFWLHCVLAILNEARKKKAILIIAYPTALVIGLITLLTDLSISHSAKTIWFDNYPQAGPFYIVHFGFFALLALYSLFELAKAYPKSKGIMRQQIKYLLIAALIGFPTGMTTYALAWQIPIYPIGFYLTWLYVPITAYAVFKYQLFDILVILRKSIIFSLLVLIVTSFYGTVVFSGQKILQTKLGLSQWLVTILASFVIAISFSPIKNLLARLTDKIFFKAQFDYKKSLLDISRNIASTIKLDELLSILDKSLKQTVRVKSLALFLFDKTTETYRQQIHEEEATRGKVKVVAQNSPLILHLIYTQKPIVAEDLNYQVLNKQVRKEKLNQLTKVKIELEKENWSLVIPLILKQKITGFLALGPKLSQDIFSKTDFQLLTTLTNQTAVAVENASLYEKERSLSKVKSEFISVASHRLRTPLSVIKWALSLLKEDKDNLSDKQSELVDKAYSANDNMIRLVNDLLNVSRIEESKYELRFDSIQLEDIVCGIISDFKPEITAKELHMNFEKPDNPLPKINLDSERIQVALENIIKNSIQYTPKQGQINVSLKLEHESQSILLTIKDNGIGIPEDKQRMVFDKFFRSENAIAAYTEGTGLGLFITKSIIEDHDGEIWFESKKDKGTTFWIKLKI